MPDEALSTSYVYGDDLISETLAGTGGSFVYHYDGLGTTRLLTKIAADATNGQVTDRYAYTAFGESDPAGSSGNTAGSTANLYRYTGEQLDPNLGLYYLRARYMEPGAGRFLGMDEYAGSVKDPLTLHRYAYASSSPTLYTDPSGRSNLAEQSFVMGGQQIVGGIVRTVPIRGMRAFAANDAIYHVGASSVSRSITTRLFANNAAFRALAAVARSSGRDRFIGVPILYTGSSDIPFTSAHISDAQSGLGHTREPSESPLTSFSIRSWREESDWYNSFSPCRDADRANFGESGVCDEYPFGSTLFGGRIGYRLNGVSLRLVPSEEGSQQGNLIGRFYLKAAISKFEEFPQDSLFFNFAGPGQSWCTDRNGNAHLGC